VTCYDLARNRKLAAPIGRAMTNAQEQPATPGERETSASRPQMPPVPPPSRGRRLSRWLWTAAVLALLFTIGVWVGRLVDFSGPAAAQPTPPPLTTTVTVPGRAPASCVSALERGEATIDLLVKGVRDQRLTDQLKSYLTAANACRKEMPSR
jgi:hypothetical protein